MLKFNHHPTMTYCEKCGAGTDTTILYWTGRATVCQECLAKAQPKAPPDPYSGHLFSDYTPGGASYSGEVHETARRATQKTLF